MKLGDMLTESRNPNTMDLDRLGTAEMVKCLQAEDQQVIKVVAEAVPDIARAVDAIAERLSKGGRMIYFGAGTSGRLAVLDASECPPTFGVDAELIQAHIAGGKEAMFTAIEGAEDSTEMGAADVDSAKVTNKDVVVGIAASGRTPYVIGALRHAQTEKKAFTICIVNNKNAAVKEFADIAIEAPVGPEALTGSTRLKAGTAQKMILNLLSTASMVKLGKVYENLMVDVKPSNKKLVERALSIICTISQASREEAEKALVGSNHNVKTAIVMLKKNLDRQHAEDLLSKNNGFLRNALQ